MREGGGGGGGEDVICLRDYKECWQNMTVNCVCVCVCVSWPNPMNSERNNIRDSIFATEQKIKHISVTALCTTGKHQTLLVT